MGSAAPVTRIQALIATRGRAAWLERCLRSLAEAVAEAPEVRLSVHIAVADADPASVAVIDRFSAEHPSLAAPAWVAPVPVGAVEARNRLLDTELGEPGAWLFFIDDDAFVDRDFFVRFLEARVADPEAVIIGGPNLTPPGSSAFQKATGLALASRFGAYLSCLRYRANGRLLACGEESLILCNLFVKVEAMEAARFPADFVCAEENWLLLALADRRRRMVLAPALFVWHERRSGPGSLLRQVFRYGCGRGQLIRRRPETVRPAHLAASLALIAATMSAALCWLSPKLARSGVLVCAGYALLCLFFAWFSPNGTGESARVRLLAAPVFAIVHVAYGTGVLWSLVRRM